MIEIKDLGFSYGSNSVLDHISMKLEDGRIYGLLGENGVGKTTLLTLLAGLKNAGCGSICTDGDNPFNRRPSLLDYQYYLPDEVQAPNIPAIRYAKMYGAFWTNFDFQKFQTILGEFEVDGSAKMNNMSTGQLKKTHIAFALSLGVKYLFLDEPTNGLDIPSKSQFRKALLKYTSDDSVVVISTHQVRDLESIIDPIIILDNNDVLLNCSIAEITEKLYFDYGNTIKPGSLYSEQLPGGFVQVFVNETGEDSKVNVEALFNAVHNNKELIKKLYE